MVKKMKQALLSFFKSKDEKSSSPWTCLYCSYQPKTLSFRANKNDTVFNFKQPNEETSEASKSIIPEFSSEDFKDYGGNSTETMNIDGLPSDRLFFEPNETSSVLKKKENITSCDGLITSSSNNNSLLLPFENTVELAVDSRNPKEDFKESIVEMVEAYGVNNWETLEKLLSWYLEVNEKRNYEFIVDAFFELFVGFDYRDSRDSSPLSIHSSSSFDSSWSTARVSSYSSPL